MRGSYGARWPRGPIPPADGQAGEDEGDGQVVAGLAAQRPAQRWPLRAAMGHLPDVVVTVTELLLALASWSKSAA